MDTYQQSGRVMSQSQPQIITCVECEEPHPTTDLFIFNLRDLTQVKRDDDGDSSALVTLEDLSDFAACRKCRMTGEDLVLAQAIANFESDQLVSCFSCAEQGRETLMPRFRARAPGWVGCNILKGYRLKLNEEEMRNPHRNPRLYVNSQELLQPGGKEGFALCGSCVGVVVQAFQKKARNIGVPENVVVSRIRAQFILDMLQGVRRKEQRDSRYRR